MPDTFVGGIFLENFKTKVQLNTYRFGQEN